MAFPGQIGRQSSIGKSSCASWGQDFSPGAPPSPVPDSEDSDRRFFRPAATNRVASVVPLTQAINVETFGGALLLMSVCETEADANGNPQENVSDERELLGLDRALDPADLLVLGGRYRHWSRNEYSNQAAWGMCIIENALLEAGVGIEKISKLVIENGFAGDPVDVIHAFFTALDPLTPDALIYYSGPATSGGAWPLGWKLKSGLHVSSILYPEDVGCFTGPVGNRLVVSDAPHSAHIWLKPQSRLLGLAAWDGDGIPGTGLGGPLLAQWLAGGLSKIPRGLMAWALPQNHGLLRLPSFHKLFYGPPLNPEDGMTAIWEVEAWILSNPRVEVKVERSAELLARGGQQVIINLLRDYAPKGNEPAVNFPNLLRLVHLLHTLVVFGPVARWMGSMWEGLEIIIHIAINGCHGKDEASIKLLAAALEFIAACTGRCTKCRDWCADEQWQQVLQLVFTAMGPDPLTADEGAAAAIMSACRAVAQVAYARTIDPVKEAQLLDYLLTLLQSPSEGVQAEAATTTLVPCMRSTSFRRRTLEKLGEDGKLLRTLEQSSAPVAGRLLALLRTIAATPVDAALKEFSGLLQSEVPSGTAPHTSAKLDVAALPKTKALVTQVFPPELVDIVIQRLHEHAEHVEVQQWGLAAFGVLLAADVNLLERSTTGGCACILRALGSAHFHHVDAVNREALSAAFILLQTVEGRAYFSAPETKLCDLAAFAVERSVRRHPPNAEVARWGLRCLEKLAGVKNGRKQIEPLVGVIIEAMLTPNAHTETLLAGSAIVSLLAASSPEAREKFVVWRRDIVKSLQVRAREAAKTEQWSDAAMAAEAELQDWAKVLLEVLGALEPPASEDPPSSPSGRKKAPSPKAKKKKNDDDSDSDEAMDMSKSKSMRPQALFKGM